MSEIESSRISSLFLLILCAVYLATPVSAQNVSVLYEFDGQTHGPAFVIDPAIQGLNGNLYSTSFRAGTHDWGTVYGFTVEGKLEVVYNFCSQPKCVDGAYPLGGLTLGRDGNAYGVTNFGGLGFGTIFRLSPSGLTVLYNFTGGQDGEGPVAPPIFGSDGALYGTTVAGGGPTGCGTLYKYETNTGTFVPLYEFDGVHGCGSLASLVQGTDGNFYGTTAGGGSQNFGVLFKMTPTGETTVLYNFPTDVDQLIGHGAPLIQGSDGNLYGTITGPEGNGSVFTITPAGTLTTLHSMNGTTDGYSPSGGLVQATDGNFYGVNEFGGGATNCGTIFQVTSAGSFSVLYNFDWTTGCTPTAGLVQHTNGLLYGDTQVGGLGAGTLYSLNVGLLPFAALVPYAGNVGEVVDILGQGFTSTSAVSFNGTPATRVGISSATFLQAVVPSRATTGFVTVTTSSGTLTSNKQFLVTP